MAIPNAQALLLLFVGSLFFSSALCKTVFGKCYGETTQSVEVAEVKISPELIKSSTNANITIIGSTSKPIPKGVDIRLHIIADHVVFDRIKSYSLCDITTCPVKPGPIQLLFSNVLTQDELDNLADGYEVSIRMTDEADLMICIIFRIEVKPFQIEPL